MKLNPVGDRVAVELITEPDTGGLILPDSAKVKNRARVLGIGPKSTPLKKGMEVIIKEHAGTIVKAEGVEVRLVPYDDILGIVR